MTINSVGRFQVAVGAIIEHVSTQKILLIQRAKDVDFRAGEWEPIYGRMAQFETPQEALVREVFEEVGIKELTVKKLISAWHIFRGKEVEENELVGITFWCQVNNPFVSLSKEHCAFDWVSLEEAKKKISSPGILADLLAFEREQT